MRAIKWKRWGVRAGVMSTVAVLAAAAWVQLQLRQAEGGATRVVDRMAFAQAPERLAITHARVLSPDGSHMLSGRTVVVEAGRIVSVSTDGAIPSGARVIGGQDRFLVPGLIDTHVHLRRSPNDLLLYLANGVTSIAEMSGGAPQLAWRRQTGQGAAGPRMFIASRKLGTWGHVDGWFQAWTRHRINVDGPASARDTVERLRADGFDAVKLGTFVDRDSYLALSRAAADRQVRLIGHIPLAVRLDDVWASSQGEIAHIEELVKALQMEFGGFSGRHDAFLAFVAKRSDQVAASLRSRGIAVSTTLWLVDSIPRQKFDLPALLREVELPYANPGLVQGSRLSPGWLPGNNPYQVEAGLDAEERQDTLRYWSTYAQAHHILLRALLDRRVQVIAGTDADNAVVVPGFSLHDELGALVAAGASNGQALRAATLAAGAWLGNGTGRIAPGAPADLLLLDADPLEDIANTRRIDTVIAGGRVFDRPRLDRMLAAVKAANADS